MYASGKQIIGVDLLREVRLKSKSVCEGEKVRKSDRGREKERDGKVVRR